MWGTEYTVNVDCSHAENGKDATISRNEVFAKAVDWFGIAAGTIKKDIGSTFTLNSVPPSGQSDLYDLVKFSLNVF